MLKFEEPLLKRDLERLPPPSRVAFAASCAQRLAGVYHRFFAQGRQPDRAANCDRALEYVWSHILAPSQPESAKQLLAEILALMPDQDAPGWTPLTAYGEDALAALAYCVSCLKSGESLDAAWAARRVYEALDFFVANRDDLSDHPDADTRVLSDPMIQAELERQAHDLDQLSRSGGSLSDEFLEGFRQRSTHQQALVVD